MPGQPNPGEGLVRTYDLLQHLIDALEPYQHVTVTYARLAFQRFSIVRRKDKPMVRVKGRAAQSR